MSVAMVRLIYGPPGHLKDSVVGTVKLEFKANLPVINSSVELTLSYIIVRFDNIRRSLVVCLSESAPSGIYAVFACIRHTRQRALRTNTRGFRIWVCLHCDHHERRATVDLF